VSLALHNHHDAKRRLPHGTYNYIDVYSLTPPPYGTFDAVSGSHGPGPHRQDRRCWMQDTMAFFEQTAQYDRFNEYMDTGGTAMNYPGGGEIVSVLMCPSDPTNPKTKTFNPGGAPPECSGFPPSLSQGFSGNYAACAGDSYLSPGGYLGSAKLNGVMFALSKIRFRDVTDGTSKTAMLGELVLSPDNTENDIRGRYYNPPTGGANFSTIHTPNTQVPDRLTFCGNPVPFAPCVFEATEVFVLARSYHPGGAHLSMVDGSVHFVSSEIDAIVYKAMGSRAGAENGASSPP
jgi:prepilin-type processing-associated H-X9-DG protein